MNLPAFSVERRVTITMLILIVALFGVIFYFQLGLDLMPEIDIPHTRRALPRRTFLIRWSPRTADAEDRRTIGRHRHVPGPVDFHVRDPDGES